MQRSTAIALLPPYQGIKNVHAGLGVGNNAQLVNAILVDFGAAVKQTRALAPRFNGGTLDATARNVWNFLKHQITYKEDSGLYQHMRLPNALVRTGVGDCKSYSLFAAGIMANLGYPVTFRFAGYSGAKHPGHVYILAGTGSSQRIIDAVYTSYNAEKKPTTYLKDYKMEIATISGIGCTDCNGVGCAGNCDSIGKVQLGKALKKAATAIKTAKKTAVTTVKKAAAPVVKAAAKLTVKAAGMAPRTAFLQLVKLNVHNFAGRLDAKRNDALKKWQQLGGMPGELNASINAGKQRKPIFGIDGIGAAAATVATILVAAAPIIAAMAAILGKDGTNPTGTSTGGNSSTPSSTAADIINAASNLINKTASPAGGPGTDPGYSGGGDYNPTSGGGNTTGEGTAAPTDNTNQNGAPKWLLPLGIGVLALMILK